MLSVLHETAIVIEPLPRKQITQYLGAKDFPDGCFQINETTCCVYFTPLCPLTWYVIFSLLETREVRYFHFKPSAQGSSFWTFIEVEEWLQRFSRYWQLSSCSLLNICRLLTFFYNSLFLWNLHLKAFGAVLNEFKSPRVYWQFFFINFLANQSLFSRRHVKLICFSLKCFLW